MTAAGLGAARDRGARATRIIGLTGPIGCGKTTVLGWLAERGAHPIDADAVARAVAAPGEPGHDAVLGVFGADVRVDDGTLDRSALARIVFRDPAALRRLEAILHPLVRERIIAEIEEARAGGAPAVVVEAIKLVEGGLAELCDEVWLVTCRSTVQRERVIDRGLDPGEADRRIAAQAGIEDRVRPVATRVIDTSGPIGDTRARVVAAWDDATSGG